MDMANIAEDSRVSNTREVSRHVQTASIAILGSELEPWIRETEFKEQKN
jgi:hypothetical protein